MATVSRDELKAILANKFGFLSGGDTKVGRFVSGLASSIERIAKRGSRNVARLTLELYNDLF